MATQDSTVTTIDEAPKAATKPRAKTIAVSDSTDSLTGDKVEVTIHAGEGEVGKQAVFLAINGHGVLIPRGVPCVVPVEIAEILDNATQTIYESGVNGSTVEREVKRFAYNVRPVREQ